MAIQLYIRLMKERIDYLWCDNHGKTDHAGTAFHPDQLPMFPKNLRTTLIIPGEHVLLLSITLPKASLAQLRKAVPYALEEQLIDDVDDLHFVLSQQSASGEIKVGVIKKTVLRDLLQRCEALGLFPEVAIPDYLALPLVPDAWHVYLDDRRALIRQADLQGLSVGAEALLDVLRLELPKKIMIDYDDANEYFDVESLNELNIEMEFAAVHEFSMELFLKGLSQNKPNFNLLQAEFVMKKAASREGKRWKLAGFLIATWFAVWLVGHTVEYFVLKHRLANLQSQVKAMYLQVFPNAQGVIDPQLRIQRLLNQVQNGQNGAEFLNLLTQVGSEIQELKLNVTISSFSYRDHILTLSLSTTNFEVLSNLTQALQQQGLTVRQDNAATQGANVTARLIVQFSGSTGGSNG